MPLGNSSESEGAPYLSREEDGSSAGLVDRVDLTRAIEGLAPGYRTTFRLHDVEGYKHNEIAAMGGSIGNSKSHSCTRHA